MNMPTVPPLFEIWHDGGFLVSEANGHRSRDGITLTGGARVLAGTVIGLVSAAAATFSAVTSPVNSSLSTPPDVSVTRDVRNVGDGDLVFTNAPPASVPRGTYKVVFTSATRFGVTGPDGVAERSLQPGEPVSVAGLSFSVIAGETRFASGDTFEIGVTDPAGGAAAARSPRAASAASADGAAPFAATAGAWAPLDPTAADGSETAAGILFGTRDATNGDVAAVAVRRDCEVNATELIWPPDVTDAQIATATAQLQALGILLR